jgi:hypothetical protein
MFVSSCEEGAIKEGAGLNVPSSTPDYTNESFNSGGNFCMNPFSRKTADHDQRTNEYQKEGATNGMALSFAIWIRSAGLKV